MHFDPKSVESLDYEPCRYGTSRLMFRGPKPDLEGDYIACLGGTDTFGRFVPVPFATRLPVLTGIDAVNLGAVNAGIESFLRATEAVEIASKARLCVVQVMSALYLSNRFYRVHVWRNDRFLAPSALLRRLYPEVDFTEFHFVGHLMTQLEARGPKRFARLVGIIQQEWLRKMTLLLGRIDAPVLLLWFSRQEIPDQAQIETGLIDRALLEQLGQGGVMDASANKAALEERTAGMVFPEFQVAAAEAQLGPAAHEQVALQIAQWLEQQG